MSELNNIALKILEKGKGILAADESTGTMTKRLDGVNVPSTPQNRLLFRETLFSASGMTKYIGGGDTVSLINQINVAEEFNFVSTAGGAFLEYLEGKELPGIKALNLNV